MVRIGIFESRASLLRALPASTRLHHLFRLPDIKEPAVRLFAQTLHLFAEMQRPLNRALDQTFTGLPRSIAAAVSIDATIG
jgi:hypothetical protein